MNKSAKLIDDEAYMTAHAKQSQYEFEYRTALPPNKLGKSFASECTPYLGGCKQFSVNAAVVDDYEKVIPGTQGWGREGSRPVTELVGGPFKARGDGALQNPDILSEAWTPSTGFVPHCNKPLSEVTFDRWPCIKAPLAYEPNWFGGAHTRQGVQFITKC
jgi:hypothetical protein